jgi:divalent metal cation (Fe/Co/Zn/Cd) transporter
VWIKHAKDKIEVLVGRSAGSFILNSITYLAMRVGDEVKQIRRVRAYHIGHELAVDVNIGMDPEAQLRECERVSKTFEKMIKLVDNVERVHVKVQSAS